VNSIFFSSLYFYSIYYYKWTKDVKDFYDVRKTAISVVLSIEAILRRKPSFSYSGGRGKPGLHAPQ
jgi:hypothetical protein